ncbi:hypothetical protein BDN72DRAFT_187813 [Pluteus cervinus]|uniref:Uncharacterized protein n=1 Tax=Pluteus cervinus TaxID=181527 RepID=A0ACD3B664_9AGAR|nr:hypothetical protein BDN72DRAFT_187813 [Pluteus cervinus]
MSSRTTTSGDSTKPPEADPSKAPKLDSNLIISSFADGSNPWEAGIQLSRDFDDEMCEMLRDELENLLLFAALFSAIVTSFATLSYQWLQPNNSNNPPPVSYNLAVQINFLWFLSLAASLSVSSIGILCMQWVRQYKRWKTKADKRTAALRRQRFEGFLRWHVPDIVAALPVILQIALVLFAIGVNSLLWSLHHIVALGFAVVSVPALVFIIATTLAPVMQWLLRLPVMGREQSRWWWSYQCPYQTPQAWLSYVVAWLLSFKRRTIDGNWAEFDKTWLLAAAGAARDDPHKTSDYENKLLVEELVWLDHEYADDVKSIKARAQALRQLPFEDAKEVVMRLFHTLTVPDADAHLKAVRGLCVKDDVTKERSFKELKVWYLWGHAQTHPNLEDAYMEARIDFMSEIPTLKIDLPGPPRADHLDVQCLVKGVSNCNEYSPTDVAPHPYISRLPRSPLPALSQGHDQQEASKKGDLEGDVVHCWRSSGV